MWKRFVRWLFRSEAQETLERCERLVVAISVLTMPKGFRRLAHPLVICPRQSVHLTLDGLLSRDVQ
jgi:hypothetical protein